MEWIIVEWCYCDIILLTDAPPCICHTNPLSQLLVSTQDSDCGSVVLEFGVGVGLIAGERTTVWACFDEPYLQTCCIHVLKKLWSKSTNLLTECNTPDISGSTMGRMYTVTLLLQLQIKNQKVSPSDVDVLHRSGNGMYTRSTKTDGTLHFIVQGCNGRDWNQWLWKCTDETRGPTWSTTKQTKATLCLNLPGHSQPAITHAMLWPWQTALDQEIHSLVSDDCLYLVAA